MTTPVLRIGDKRAFLGGGGMGAYDPALGLRIVLGGYDVARTEPKNGATTKRISVITFNWAPRDLVPGASDFCESRRLVNVEVANCSAEQLLGRDVLLYQQKAITADDLRSHVDDLVMEYMTIEILTHLLKERYESGMERGRQNLQNDLHKLLGIYR